MFTFLRGHSNFWELQTNGGTVQNVLSLDGPYPQHIQPWTCSSFLIRIARGPVNSCPAYLHVSNKNTLIF